MPIDEENNSTKNEQASPANPPATGTPAADNPPAAENTVANETVPAETPAPNESKPEVSGTFVHQSEFNTDNGAYSQKTGLRLNVTDGPFNCSTGIYIKDPTSFQGEFNCTGTFFNHNFTPQDNFKVSAGYRNQLNLSTNGVTDQNRVSVEQSYTHKFDNGWKVGAYTNENVKVTFSGNGVTPSVGYIAGVSAGKGRVSGYVEHQGDWKIAKQPTFGSCVNVGVKVSL